MQRILNIFDTQRSQFFLWTPVFFGIGIFIFFNIAREPSIFEVIALFVGTITIVAGLWWVHRDWRMIPLVFILISVGFLNSYWRTNSVAGPILGWHYYGPVEGTVVALDRSASDKPRVTLGGVKLKNVPHYKTPTFVRISLHGKSGIQDPVPGMRIAMTARLSPPSGPTEPGGFDFQRHAWFRGLGAVGYTRTPALNVGRAEDLGLTGWLFKTRMSISRSIQNSVEGQTGAFASAILTGDRSSIDPERLRDLRGSNLAHLLAISGLHMGLLTGFVFALVRTSIACVPRLALRVPSKKVAAVLALFSGLAYLALSGASVATQRAFIMVCVMLCAVLLDRPAISLRSVAIAALVILIIKPESLTEAGFQMSFAATSALVASFAALRHSKIGFPSTGVFARFTRPVLSLVFASAIAGAATAPLSAYHFNQFASYGLIANLLSVPAMGMLVMPCAVVAGLLAPFGLSDLPFWLMGLGIDWILFIAHWVTNMDGSVHRVPVGGQWDLPVFIFGALFVLIWQGRSRVLGLAPMAVAVFMWTSAPRPQVLIADNGRLVGLMTPDGRSLNRKKGNGFVARVWLENDGDAVDQIGAAGRFKLEPDLFDLIIGDQKVTYVWNRKIDLTELKKLCSQTDVLLAPTWKDDFDGDCDVYTIRDLRETGALSMTSDKGEMVLRTAKEMSGDRLWNTRAKRSKSTNWAKK